MDKFPCTKNKGNQKILSMRLPVIRPSDRLLFGFFEIHGKGIDTIPLATLVSGTVGEFMSQVASTIGADDFFADHPVGFVQQHLYRILRKRCGKAWPTGMAFIFGG